jgi:phage I-like protein
MGLIYARGLKAKENVRKAGAAREVGKRIAGLSKKTGAGPTGQTKQARTLTPMQKQAAQLGGMTEQEYWEEKFGRKKK